MIFQSFGFFNRNYIPIIDYSLDLGWFYLLFVVFWLVGFSNAVNLTDGLDGLLIWVQQPLLLEHLLYWHGIQDQFDVAIFCVQWWVCPRVFSI